MVRNDPNDGNIRRSAQAASSSVVVPPLPVDMPVSPTSPELSDSAMPMDFDDIIAYALQHLYLLSQHRFPEGIDGLSDSSEETQSVNNEIGHSDVVDIEQGADRTGDDNRQSIEREAAP